MSEFRPKLIGTDLDGTIVPHFGDVSARTIRAFNRAYDAGIHIYFVTGRPPRWMSDIKNQFGFGTGICANGAMLYDIVNEQILEQWLIPIDTQKEITAKLRKAIPTVAFAIDIEERFHREFTYEARWDAGLDDEGVFQIESVMNAPAPKLLARCSNQDLTSDEMLEIAHKVLEGVATVTHSNARESLLEISALGVSKGETLAKIAQRHGITAEDVVTFGDNPNDFSMLSWAHRSWGMSDGHPDLAKFAKSLAEPHDEDGVAKIIERLLELPEK